MKAIPAGLFKDCVSLLSFSISSTTPPSPDSVLAYKLFLNKKESHTSRFNSLRRSFYPLIASLPLFYVVKVSCGGSAKSC